jgi:hypothetical protein
MNAAAVTFETEAQTSPLQFGAHRQTRVHRIGGLGEMLRWTWLALGLKKHPKGCGPKRHGWERAEHHWYQESLAHLLGLGASKVLA